MRAKLLTGTTLALGLGATLYALPAASTGGPPSPVAHSLAPNVSVVAARTREIVRTLMVSGTLVPRDEIMVTPEIEGQRVTAVLVEEGAVVHRGQVLARLSHDLIDLQLAQQEALVAKATATVPQAQTSIDQAEAAVVEARQSLERARSLMSSGNTTAAVMETRVAAARQAEGRLAYARNGLDIAKAELAQAVATRDELRLRLARTEVKSPDNGVVSRRAARVGMLASASAEPLFHIIARNEIELEGDVVGTELPKVREGDRAWIDLDGVKVPGAVRVVYPEVDKSTRLGKVRIRLEPDPRLRIGAFADGGVEIERTRGVVVPQSAVLHEAGGRSSVLVAKDDVLSCRVVRPGVADEDQVQVGGLAAGEAVVAKAGSFLRDGDRIRAVRATPVAAAGDDTAPRRTAAASTP